MSSTSDMVDKVLGGFQDLIRRSIAPSVAFYVAALTVDLLGARLLSGQSVSERVIDYRKFIESVAPSPNTAVVLTVMIVFIIGMSYALMVLQQVLFDNMLKTNFLPLLLQIRAWYARIRDASAISQYPCAANESTPDPLPIHGFSKREVLALQQLRKRVVDRLDEVGLNRLRPQAKDAPLTDYVLYEILGGIDPTPTHPFVDSAKAMGVVFVSIILVLVGNALLNPLYWSWRRWWCIPSCIVLGGLSYWAGYNVNCAQYRARALRLYVNFLAMPVSRINYLLFPEEWASAPGQKGGS